MKPLRLFILSLLSLGFLTESAFASPLIYSDNDISITLPEDMQFDNCSNPLNEKFPSGCQFILPLISNIYPIHTDHFLSLIHQPKEPTGIIFVTIADNFTLHSTLELQKHLDDSESALSNHPAIRVMQSRILSDHPLTGMMDILRKDGILPEIEALSQPPVRQTSFIFPTKDKLVQVFFYLPLDGQNVETIYTQLLNFIPNHVQVFSPPVEIPDEPKEEESFGVLSLMPRALMIGGIFAVLFIILLTLRTRLARKYKDRQMQQQDEIVKHAESDSEDQT